MALPHGITQRMIDATLEDVQQAEHEYQLRFIQLLDAGLSEEEADKIAMDHAWGKK